MRDPLSFWSFFYEMRESIESGVSRFHGVVPDCEARRIAPALLGALDGYHRGLTLEIDHLDGLFGMIVGAGGAPEHFDAARDLVAAAPLAPGWLMRALGPRREPGEAVHEGGVTLRLDGLRFAYGLANDRMVVMALAEHGPFEAGPAAHFLVRRLVRDLLGEEDFALWIADARLMRYEDWLATVPGGRSWPMRDLPARFDAIFHPPPRARAPASAQGPALALSA